jgi:N-methylhydantoinase B
MVNQIQSSLGVDAARFEVVKNALHSAAEEMKIVLAKTAYSPLLKVSGDYSCGLFDITGNMVAQGPDLPLHLGSMPDTVRAVVKTFPDVRSDDVFIHNDPYHGGSHLPDVNIITPAFAGDRLLGYACVRAHWPDIGSASPGSYGAVTEIYGEGLRIPPVRLFRNGTYDPGIVAIIFANVRTPSERKGDLSAQIAATRRGCLRLVGLAEKYGVEQLFQIMSETLDYSERMMRSALSQIPNGEASFTDVLDGDGIIAPGDLEDETFKISMKIVKSGSEVHVDFAGSDPQVAGPMNAPLTVTASGVFCAIKMIVDANNMIPPNSGCWRPVKITAPEGSVVNAQEPAPVVYANHEVSQRVADMVFAAMFKLTPHNVMCGSQGTGGVTVFGGTDYRTGERFVSYEVLKGGFGARPNKDGINAVSSSVGNMMNTPIEILEMSFPLRVEEYALIPDSGGAGTWRGGLAPRRSWRVLERDLDVSVCCERTVTPAFGLDGGLCGAPGRVSVRRPDGEVHRAHSKGAFVASAGSVVMLEAPGSGGFGHPSGRNVASLCDDLIDGYVTEAAAKRDYGIDPSALMKEHLSAAE